MRDDAIARGDATPAGPGEPLAVLVEPTQYTRHLNEVAAVWPDHLLVVKKKFVSRAGYELVEVPISDCAHLKVHDERPLGQRLAGVLLLGLVVGVLVLLVTSWRDLEPGTRVPVGALALAGLYGFRWSFRARRHRLVFRLKDRSTLTWRSRPGEHERYRAAVERVVALARSRDFLESTVLVRS